MLCRVLDVPKNIAYLCWVDAAKEHCWIATMFEIYQFLIELESLFVLQRITGTISLIL